MLFDYYCEPCDRVFEIEHRIGKTARKCPGCKAFTLRRRYAATPVHLKGSGWPGKEIAEGRRG